ncbi:hypothetical protein FAEPRAA2165_03550, partial [Faecalibacterium duncaniae]
FQLFQALLAVVQLWPLGPVLQIFFQRSLQRLGGELPVFMDRAMVFWVTSSCNMNPSLLQKIQSGS